MAVYAQQFLVQGENLEHQLKEFIHYYNQNNHTSIYPGGLIHCHEDYSLLNENRLMVCIRLDTCRAADNIYLIEIIAGGALDGLINLFGSGGAEHRRIERFREKLETFCKTHKANLTVIASKD